MLETLITSKTRLRLLIKFFLNNNNNGYLNGLANEFGESTNSVRKELNKLFEAGYLKKKSKNNKIYYSANNKHILFSPLQNIIKKHLGIETIIENILDKIGPSVSIFLIGDYVLGLDSGHIEIIIVGEKIDKKFVEELCKKLEHLIQRKVSIEFSPNEPVVQDSIQLI